RPAKTAAELIAFERRHISRIEKVSRIEVAVPQKFERRAVKLIRSRLGNCAYHCTAGASVFGAKSVCKNLKLLNRVGARESTRDRTRCVVVGVVQKRSIQKKTIRGYPRTVDCDLCCAGADVDRVAGIEGGGAYYTNLQGRKLKNVSAVEWQF